MKLLYTKRSPYARKPRVIALEKGIHLELIDEDLAKKSQLLLDANPLGKVPTLILEDGSTVYDSPVICQYLDALNDKNGMIPKDAKARLNVLKWEAFADDLVTAAINTYMEKIRHPENFHKDFVAGQEKNILKSYQFIESHLAELKTFNLASVAVASAIGYIHFRLPHLKVQGKLSQWFDEISARPSMQQTVPVV
ncbi:MAG: glutathione S-transferase N-terminal domain-containing protein [Candidatus Omnitrophica bacterium]|nr:glutathione S-transferase N-terminal domain-containing protein [Candidatus Omnitrophota bacterium]